MRRGVNRLRSISNNSVSGVVSRSLFNSSSVHGGLPTLVYSRKFSTASSPSPSSSSPAYDNLTSHTKKQRVALVVSYIGTGYYGSQINKGFPTIEATLHEALYKSGGVLESNYFSDISQALKRIGWSRGSRTDKGVHALTNVLSVKLETPDRCFEKDPLGFDIADNINKHLPENIRVQAVIRVPKSFDPRGQTSLRSYKLLWPKEYLGGLSIEELREVFSLFIGLNDFHNFCKDSKAYGDMMKKKTQNEENELEENEEHNNEERTPVFDRANEEKFFTRLQENYRQIQIADVLESSKTPELVSFHLVGSSFGMHQVRKMVAFLLMVSNSKYTTEILSLALESPYIINIPLTPSFSLYYEGGTFVNRDWVPVDPFGINTHIPWNLAVDYPIVKEKERPQPHAPEWGSLMDKIERGEETKNVTPHGRELLQRLLLFRNDKLLPHIQQLREKDDQFKRFFESTIHSPRYVIPDLDDLRTRFQVIKKQREEKKLLREQRKLSFEERKLAVI
eukprot:TRINITY_DN340_c1_g3_i2.p1 TRINITY_DN340_c1_g3~~TRINITY_DN340_c1_g3_i2.p1  ORF type:complete len:538 (+),score=106.89 TRINITY_DN340_c1_g3_i2:95-1615(+)